MTRSFLITAVLASVTATQALAATIPLLEFNFQQSDVELGPLPDRVEFRFAASGEFSTQYLDWRAQHGPADVGMSFWATPDIIEGATVALMDPSATYSIYNGPGNFQGPTYYTKLVTADLANYAVTAVERVINHLGLIEIEPHEPPGRTGSWAINASQTIRYWGVPVPESGSAVLFSIGVAHLGLNCRRRRPS